MKESQTILKKDGRVDYLPRFLSSKESEGYFNLLKEEINWKKDELIMFGKRIVMRRESAWFADEERPYKYAGINRQGETWTPHLSELKNRVEDFLGLQLNSCLANYYFDGHDGMGFHSDDEKMLNPEKPIISISLGAERIFQFQHKKTKALKEVWLEDGSLLVMHPPCQVYWKHALRKNKKQDQPRINLTFRVILNK